MSGFGAMDDDSYPDMANQKWKRQLGVVDKAYRGLFQDTTNAEKMLSSGQVEMERLQPKIHELTVNSTSLMQKVSELINLAKSANVQNQTVASKYQRDSKSLIGRIQKISQDVLREGKRRSESRGQQQPWSENNRGYSTDQGDVESGRGRQYQITADPQLAAAQRDEEAMSKVQGDLAMLEETFTKLATMVHDQGEMVDSIEANVTKASDQVEEANIQLYKGVKLKRSILKKKICIIGIVIAILAVIGLIIGLSLGLKT